MVFEMLTNRWRFHLLNNLTDAKMEGGRDHLRHYRQFPLFFYCTFFLWVLYLSFCPSVCPSLSFCPSFKIPLATSTLPSGMI